ncbi:MAG: hypothetical protein AAFY65_03260 [Pseudomonadota bacterium]
MSPLLLPLAAVAVLAACNPPIPDSGARGPGFDTPQQYAARREAELRRGGASTGIQGAQTIRPPATAPVQTASATPFPAQGAPAQQVASAPIGAPAPLPTAAQSAPANTSEAQQIANQARAALGQPAAAPVAGPAPLPTPAPIASASTTGTGSTEGGAGLSREQDFAAVSAERDIAADAERQRQLRQQYQLVTPTALQRPSDDGPNIIAYALNQAQPKGASGTFRRNPLASQRRAQNNCRGYRTADVAQEDFLAAGGPQRDRLNLDPDGDGNACGWDPATFRSLVRN